MVFFGGSVTTTTNGGNIYDDQPVSFSTNANDRINVSDIHLSSSLGANGGGVRTLKLASNSAALGRGTGTIGAGNIPTDDARRFERAGNPDPGAYEFEGTFPAIELFPEDDATGVTTGTNLVLTFAQNVTVSTGNITIRRVSDNVTTQSIAVNSGSVTGGGTKTITINPSSDLGGSTAFYVEIPASAFDSIDQSTFAGISGNSEWNFTTVSNTPPTISTNQTAISLD